MRWLPLMLLAGLVLPAAAPARVFHDPCPAQGVWANGRHLASDSWHLNGDALARETDHYRNCGPVFSIERGRNYLVRGPRWPRCSHYFALGGTTRGVEDPFRAHWDFWADNGSWVTWPGPGHWSVNPHDGNLTGFGPLLHNWNVFADWPVRVFSECVRTHMPPS